MSDREQFLAERRGCIGGSDAADLLQLAPFGCRRKLWYDKKGVEPDYPFNETYHVRRGTALEPIAIAEFLQEFNALWVTRIGGATAQKPPTMGSWPHVTMDDYPFIGCHVDGYIAMPGREGTGVLEIKVPSARHFASIKASGTPPLSWQVQAQWNMMVTGLKWAAIGVFNPDLFKILRFEMGADGDLQKQMRGAANVFWATLTTDENPYDKLPTGDDRCDKCQWRTKCKGIGQTMAAALPHEQIDVAKRLFVTDNSPGLVNLVDAYVAAAEEKREAVKFYDALKEELQDKLAGENVIIADGRKVFAQETQVPIAAKAAYVQKRVTLKIIEP